MAATQLMVRAITDHRIRVYECLLYEDAVHEGGRGGEGNEITGTREKR